MPYQRQFAHYSALRMPAAMVAARLVFSCAMCQMTDRAGADPRWCASQVEMAAPSTIAVSSTNMEAQRSLDALALPCLLQETAASCPLSCTKELQSALVSNRPPCHPRPPAVSAAVGNQLPGSCWPVQAPCALTHCCGAPQAAAAAQEEAKPERVLKFGARPSGEFDRGPAIPGAAALRTSWQYATTGNLAAAATLAQLAPQRIPSGEAPSSSHSSRLPSSCLSMCHAWTAQRVQACQEGRPAD